MKYLLSILVLLFTVNCQAQYQYVPIPTDDAHWNYVYAVSSSGYSSSNNYHLIFKGDDTTINNIKYNKLYYRASAAKVSYSGSPPNYDPIPNYANKPDTYFGGIREANKKVYIKKAAVGNSPDTVERLLYDFNLKFNDTMPSNESNHPPHANFIEPVYKVISIDTISINGTLRKRFIGNRIVSGTSGSITVIEGIGSTHGLLRYRDYVPVVQRFKCFLDSKSNSWYIVDTPRCAYTHEYGTPTSISTTSTNAETNIYPNPATDFVTLEVPTGTNISIYNSTGKKVSASVSTQTKEQIELQELPAGLYIINLYNEQAGLNERRKIMKL